MSESGIQSRVRLRAAELGWRVWRNNVGAGKLENGSFIRWGIANDSSALNARLKSSDLIGFDHTGRFVAIECKHGGWRYNPHDAHEAAQQAFIQLVRAGGGRAGFICDPSQLEQL
jgi:hypothetical protein